MNSPALYSCCPELEFFIPAGLTAETRISKQSSFGDDTWNYSDASNPRLNAYPASSLTIKWSRPASETSYSPLPWSTLIVLKLFAYLYLQAPATVVSRCKREHRNHPATVCQSFKTLIPFIAHLQEKYQLDVGEISDTWSLADVTVRQLRESLVDWDFGSGPDLKRALVSLTSSVIQQACPNTAPRWNASDVRSLDFKSQTKRENYVPVFPNP
jgi:hypothetical protein